MESEAQLAAFFDDAGLEKFLFVKGGSLPVVPQKTKAKMASSYLSASSDTSGVEETRRWFEDLYEDCLPDFVDEFDQEVEADYKKRGRERVPKTERRRPKRKGNTSEEGKRKHALVALDPYS